MANASFLAAQGDEMSLIDEINERRREIRTDGYSMSIGEWISLYENNEIDIHPEFQRFFRWSESQKTNLIESILLGIPIPPIFVSQRADGVWDVVDGLQRLSTIYQLLGILRDENGNLVAPLTLQATGYLPSLEGKKWDDGDAAESVLPPEARLIIKRAKISASIILRESDDKAKYDLFQRLNTGGSRLSPQEVRNCILVMVNREMFFWLRDLAKYETFQQCVSLSDRPLEEAYDVELVLRFVILSQIEVDLLSKVGDAHSFLTDQMVGIANDPNTDRNAIEDRFRRTFDVLERSVGSDAFKRYNVAKGRHEGGFLLSQYEVVALGLGYNIDHHLEEGEIPEAIKRLWSTKGYTDWAGSGITAMRRLPRLIPLGREMFRAR